MNKQHLSTIGLLFITFLSAIQYGFLSAVPDTVSTFSFIFITNLVGLVLLGAIRFKSLKLLNRSVLKKGFLFALELIFMNYFLLQGSKGTDTVIISSVVAMYFVFVTPMLLLLKKKVSFFSGMASVIAVIALFLMLGLDTGNITLSWNLIYLFIADFCFAAFVVSVSILGEKEDPAALTISQMLFVMLFALIGWIFEVLIGSGSFFFPADRNFWICVLFIGICIRALYGIIQMACQKNVAPIRASLIFSSEIIISFLVSPLLSRLLGTTYTPINLFQLAGCFLFIFAAVISDDSVLDKIGYADVASDRRVNAKGRLIERSSISRKMISLTINFSLAILIITTIICIASINYIRGTTVANSTELGEQASEIGSRALSASVFTNLSSTAEEKADLASEQLTAYERVTENLASYTASLYEDPDNYGRKEVMYPMAGNDGKWTMQRGLLNRKINYEDVKDEVGLLGNLESVLKPSVQSTDNISTIYIGTESGVMISYDRNSASAASGGEIYYNFHDTEWYQKAEKTKKKYIFIDSYADSYGRGLTITCVSPIRDSSGNFLGCVAADIQVDSLNDTIVNEGISDSDTALLINKDGEILAGGKINSDSDDTASIYDGSAGIDLSNAADTILAEKSGVTQTGDTDDADTFFIAYHNIPDTDWIICIASPAAEVMAPVTEIDSGIEKNTDKIITAMKKGIINVTQLCLLFAAFILILVTLSVGTYARRIVSPLKTLEKDVQMMGDGNLDWKTEVSTNDEVGSLADAFNEMASSLRVHIAELQEITAKESRINAELDVAAKIQASYLPKDFPDYIYATMASAKEVGGDFYDFFPIDDTHIGLVMADVSGKGVPAAMFMMISKVLLKRQFQSELSPAKVLAAVNNQLCDGNDEEMFVTVWLGVADTATGVITAANAGHEYPAVYHKGGKFELLRDKHGFVLAGMENMKYKEYEIPLRPGDRIFLYTDGVAEASNANDELFGTDRMIDALNAVRDESLPGLIEGVRRAIDDFVQETPQFDDITMLCYEQKEFPENE